MACEAGRDLPYMCCAHQARKLISAPKELYWIEEAAIVASFSLLKVALLMSGPCRNEVALTGYLDGQLQSEFT